MRPTSLSQLTRRCWTCGKPKHYKKNRKLKGIGTSKDLEVTQSTEGKSMEDEKGNVYLASTSTQMERESWLIESKASFHMTPHRHWLCEYDERKSGDVLLGDDSMKRMIGRGKFRLILNNGRRGTLPGVFHIPGLVRNIIFVSTTTDAGVRSVFEKDTCKMVRGSMVLI